MQVASYSPPLVFLCSKELASRTATLSFEGNEFGYVVNADQDVARVMNWERRNRDVEIITGECSGPTIDAAEASPRTGCYFAESLQDRNRASIAAFH